MNANNLVLLRRYCVVIVFFIAISTINSQTIDLFSSSGQFIGSSPFSYRIPALAVTNTGRILAVCDARYGTTADLPNDIDLVMRTSDDNGMTWTARQTIVNSGTIGSGDPQILVDKTTGDIFIFYAYKVRWTSPVEEIRYIKSTDNGDTWSNPVDIKNQVFNPNAINMWAGPGNGIQLRSGRLVVPFSLNAIGNQDSIQTCFIYSDDHGQTWSRSTNASSTGLEEPTMVELNNGQLLLNARSRRGFARRGISYTDSLGSHWSTTYDHPDLLDPIVQGSMIRYTSVLDGYAKNRLLFSNPSHLSNRENLTIFISYDEGQTWSVSYVVDAGGAAYSSLTVLPNEDIGILYERDYAPHGLFGIIYPNHISFRRLTLNEISNDLDSLSLNTSHLILENDENNIRLFPNPSKGQLLIELEDMHQESLNIELYNSLGQLIQRSTIPPFTKSKQLSLEGIEAGSYFIRIRNQQQYYTKQIRLISSD